MNTSGLYFIRAENGLVKIGISNVVQYRVEEIRRASPVPVELVAWVPEYPMLRGGYPSLGTMERRVHHFLRHLRHHGEWFESHPDIEVLISAAKTDPKAFRKSWGSPYGLNDAEEEAICLQSVP